MKSKWGGEEIGEVYERKLIIKEPKLKGRAHQTRMKNHNN